MDKTYEEKREEFISLVAPLMAFLRDNFHPHVSIIVTPLDAEVLTGEIAYSEEDDTGRVYVQ